MNSGSVAWWVSRFSRYWEFSRVVWLTVYVFSWGKNTKCFLGLRCLHTVPQIKGSNRVSQACEQHKGKGEWHNPWLWVGIDSAFLFEWKSGSMPQKIDTTKRIRLCLKPYSQKKDTEKDGSQGFPPLSWKQHFDGMSRAGLQAKHSLVALIGMRGRGSGWTCFLLCVNSKSQLLIFLLQEEHPSCLLEQLFVLHVRSGRPLFPRAGNFELKSVQVYLIIFWHYSPI